MKSLKINANKIKDMIELKDLSWNYPSSTNCYAYALGLDVPCSKISNHAYMLGCFSEDYLKKKGIDVYSLSFEKRLQYDLECLGLSHEEVDPDYKLDNIDINYSHFLISFFNQVEDYHFLRKSNINNAWYHKKGYFDLPKARDDDGKLITDPRDAFFIYYNYAKTLKIGYKNKR